MDYVAQLRINFDRASREAFIYECLDLIDKSRGVFATQAGLQPRDLALLSQEMSPLMKYHSLNVQFVDQFGSVAPDQRQRAYCLTAGVVVYERARQTMDWLDCYSTFTDAVTGDDLESFPVLNVRQAVKPDFYDRVTGREYPAKVRYALMISDRAFERVKNCERYLRLDPPF